MLSKISCAVVFVLVVGTSLAHAQGASPLEDLESATFSRSFSEFVDSLRSTHPELNIPQSGIAAPAFQSGLSRNAWLALFENTLHTELQLSATDLAKWSPIESNQFNSYANNEAYARVSYVGRVASVPATTPSEKISTSLLSLPRSWPTDHTMNLSSYVNERFSDLVQSFIKNHAAQLVMDQNDCSSAFIAQAQNGYSDGLKIFGLKDPPDTQFYLLKKDNSYRFLVCELFGSDDVKRIAAIWGPAFPNSSAQVIVHTQKSPLFYVNDTFQKLQVDAEHDRVFIGFENSVYWDLYVNDSRWQRIPLITSGLELWLLTNPGTHQSFISVENVYGDEMLEALRLLYEKGYRRFVYMGTAGGLGENLQQGAILFPTKFQFDANEAPQSFAGTLTTQFEFKNDAMTWGLEKQFPKLQFVPNSVQGWVPDLVVETKPFMNKQRDNGVSAIDVETIYFAQFFNSHPAKEKSIVIVVSDLPLGGLTFDQEGATRDLPMTNIKSLIPSLLAM